MTPEGLFVIIKAVFTGSESMKLLKGDGKSLRWIAKKSKNERKRILILAVLGMISSAIGVFEALCYREIIDRILPTVTLLQNGTDIWNGMGTTGIINWSFVFLAVVVLSVLLSLSSKYLHDLSFVNMLNHIRLSVIKTLFKKDYKSVSGYHTGEILNRMFSDARLISENTISLVPSFAGLIVKLFGSLVFLFFISREFTVLLLICGILMAVFATTMRKKMKRLHKDVQEADGKVRSAYQEQTAGILMIKIFGADKKMADAVEEKQNAYKGRVMRQRVFSCIVNLGYILAYNFLLLLAFFFSVYSIIKGTMGYGSLTAIMQLSNSIQGSVASLSGILPRIYSTTASAERIMELEELPDEETVPCTIDDVDTIRFEDVTFSYGRESVLKHIDFSVGKGEIVAIQGASGIGKSTILMLLLGIYPPEEGKVILTSGDTAIQAGKGTRKLFSFTPQGNQLFSGTIRENVVFARENVSQAELDRALSISCADEFIKTLPDGLDTLIGEHGKGLSEGQQQRIAIARALLSDAPVLLFDEATSALDEATERRLIENLKEVRKTCLVITHRKSPLSICTSAYVLNESGIRKIEGEDRRETV